MRVRRLIRLALITLIATLVAGLVQTARAEISGRPRADGRVDTLIMGDAGITDGVDPIPQIWAQLRPLPPAWVLNPSGEIRGDGRPDVFFHRTSGIPIVVWSYNHGDNFDVALSYWQGDGWSPIEFITSTSQNELDPRVFVRSDGTIYVVWWVPGPDSRVELTSRAQDGDFWTPPIEITDINEPGSRPTVAFHGNAIWVAYERAATQSVFNTREVAVRRQNQAGFFVLEFLADTEYDGPVDPVLHVKPGTMWMDWRYSVDQFAYAEINDPAGGANLETWTDPSWIGIESVRLLIANLVGTAQPNETEPGGGDGGTVP